MKYVCKQVNPEYQESPMYYDMPIKDNECYKGLFLIPCDNCYGIHEEEIEELRHGVYDIVDVLEEIIDNGYAVYYKNFSEAVNEILPRFDGKKYSTRQIHRWKELVNEFDEDSDDYANILSLITGNNWESRSIHGCCQGDYAEVIYSTEGNYPFNDKAIKAIETEYFNIGSEWECSCESISDEEAEAMEETGDIDVFEPVCAYAYEWDDDDIREELADAIGCDSEDVIMYKYSGSHSISDYERI